MKGSDVLKKARDRITNPENWCKGTMAKTAYGVSTCVHDEKACQWCSLGAIEYATGGLDMDCQFALVLDVMASIKAGLEYPYSISNFNDNSSHEEVLEVFDHAIFIQMQKEKEREQLSNEQSHTETV
jgi:hypothetical protein